MKPSVSLVLPLEEIEMWSKPVRSIVDDVLKFLGALL
jgi:hypothetical protein